MSYISIENLKADLKMARQGNAELQEQMRTQTEKHAKEYLDLRAQLEAATARAEKAEKAHSDLIDFVSKKVREHEESKDWEQREYAPIVISEIGEYLEELKAVGGE